jgi:hypothetical protein
MGGVSVIRYSVCLAMLLLGLVACSEIRDPDDGPTRLEEWEENLPQFLEAASDYQDRIIGDGLVTEEEHETALADFRRCVEERTGAIISVERESDGQVGVIGTTLGGSAELDRCREEYFMYVAMGYDAMVNRDVTRGGLVRATVDCLRDHGIDLPPDADQLELFELSRHVAAQDDDAGAVRTQFNECVELQN